MPLVPLMAITMFAGALLWALVGIGGQIRLHRRARKLSKRIGELEAESAAGRKSPGGKPGDHK